MPSFDPAGFTNLTFDCYGTLVDWEAGMIAALRPLLDAHHVTLSDDEIIAAASAIEQPFHDPPYQSYRSILARVVEGFGHRFGFVVPVADRSILAASVPLWMPFADTVEALHILGSHYRLAVISNIDDDLFEATAKHLEVKFDEVITAEQAQSYKPHREIFEQAIHRLGVPVSAIAHVAEGVSEISPARQLGCSTVWVRRNGRSARLLSEAPDEEVPDLRSLVNRMGWNDL